MNNTIPEQISKFASSTEFNDAIDKIGDIFGLHIDQIGELDAEIRDILTGASKASDFSKHIKERLEIDDELTQKIIKEVNVQIFDALKHSLQSQTDEKLENKSNLEEAGKFTIEKESSEDLSNGGVTSADKEKILNHLENPPWRSTPEATSADTKPAEHETFTEPIVDLLLANPSARPAETVVRKIEPVAPANLPIAEAAPGITKPIEPAKPAAAPIPKRTGPDPYKEPIE